MPYWLDVQPGDKVLDLGSGSGWTSAILAGLVGDASRVTAVDRFEELVYFGRNNCSRSGFFRNPILSKIVRPWGGRKTHLMTVFW